MNLRHSHERIKLALFLSKLSAREFCRRTSFSHGTLKLLCRTENISNKLAGKLSKAFMSVGVVVSDHWLMTGVGDLPFRSKDFEKSLDNASSFYNEIDFYKQLNSDSQIIDIQLHNDYDRFLKCGDIIAGFVENRKFKLLNKFCIVGTQDGLYKVGYIDDLNRTENTCILDGERVHYSSIALVNWIRKID